MGFGSLGEDHRERRGWGGKENEVKVSQEQHQTHKGKSICFHHSLPTPCPSLEPIKAHFEGKSLFSQQGQQPELPSVCRCTRCIPVGSALPDPAQVSLPGGKAAAPTHSLGSGGFLSFRNGINPPHRAGWENRGFNRCVCIKPCSSWSVLSCTDLKPPRTSFSLSRCTRGGVVPLCDREVCTIHSKMSQTNQNTAKSSSREQLGLPFLPWSGSHRRLWKGHLQLDQAAPELEMVLEKGRSQLAKEHHRLHHWGGFGCL